MVDKLHKVTKARHELETQLREEIERNRTLEEVNKLKDTTLDKKQETIDELDRKVTELER